MANMFNPFTDRQRPKTPAARPQPQQSQAPLGNPSSGVGLPTMQPAQPPPGAAPPPAGPLSMAPSDDGPRQGWTIDDMFMPTTYLGGRPGYVPAAQQQALATGQRGQQNLEAIGQSSIDTARGYGGAITDFGMRGSTDIANYGQQQGAGLIGQGNQFMMGGVNAANRNIYDADFGRAQGFQQAAAQQASNLAQLEAQAGPTGAQAQLQAGLNQAQMENLALARSGRGFGGSATAMQQALGQNASMGQQAVNQSAMLRAQEDAAARARMAQNLQAAAGIQSGLGSQSLQQQQLGGQLSLQEAAQNDALRMGLSNLGLQSQLGGAGLGMQGLAQGYGMGLGALGQAGQMELGGLGQAGQQYGMGTQLGFQGQGMAHDLARTQAQLQQGDAAQMAQIYGINSGVNVSNSNQALQLIGAGVSAVGAAGAAMSDRAAKTNIEPAKEEDLKVEIDRPTYVSDSPRNPLVDYGLSQAAPSTQAQWSSQGAISPQAMRNMQGGAPEQRPQQSSQFANAMGSAAQNFGGGLQGGGNPYVQQLLNTPNMAMSDRAAKTDIAELSRGEERALAQIDQAFAPRGSVPTASFPPVSEAQEAIAQAPGYSFNYRDPARHGEGRRVGIMAQDLERTPLGQQAVMMQPDGTRAVDVGQVAMMTAAAQHGDQERIDDLERELDMLRSRVSRGQSSERGTY